MSVNQFAIIIHKQNPKKKNQTKRLRKHINILVINTLKYILL
jgi:glucose uptake protein GlcU